MTTPSKVILAFCDGTGQDGIMACDAMGDQTTVSATNVLRLSRAVNPSKTLESGAVIPQIVFYQSGVGTESDFGGSGNITAALIQAFGRVVASKIRDVYMFIAQNYLPGDEICLFGYSRGAYTARKVAGLIDRIGILPRKELGRFSQIWKELNEGKYNGPRPSLPVQIKCVGVWDTVGSVYTSQGKVIDALSIKDCSLPECVENALHGLAFHENRTPMVPTLWDSAPKAGQNLKQVWFAGGHANVGGGLVNRELADLSLFWMAGEVVSFISLDLDILWASHTQKPIAGWGASQPYNSFHNETLMRLLGSTTRLPQFSKEIKTQLHESLKYSPIKLDHPLDMITIADIPPNRLPAYAALNTLELELNTKWVASGNSGEPDVTFEGPMAIAALFSGLAGDVLTVTGNIARGGMGVAGQVFGGRA